MVKFNNLRLTLGMALKCGKRVETKSKKEFTRGLIPTFVEVTWEKMVGGLLAHSHSLPHPE